MTGAREIIRSLNLNLSLKFILGCSAALVIALVISFHVIAARQERLILGQKENEARAIFRQIVITRSWIADHGGIFVEKLPWVKSTPYLKDPEMTDIRGRRYVKETPAMVTKELSRYAREKGLYWFHITSLRLTNPENAPDEFEKKALAGFEDGSIKEFVSIDTADGSRVMRYVSPLYVEEACLKCHGSQGYGIGDVRGAISITIPMDKTFEDISADRKSMFTAGTLTVVFLIFAMFLMMKNLVLTPMKKLQSSIKDFSAGKYSPDMMLRTGDEFEDLCRAFSEMAGTLTEYHNSLNYRIGEATKHLEDTNLKLLEANRLLSETSVRKSDFMARASHELRTPLTSIRGAMDYISAKLSVLMKERPADPSLDDLRIFFEVVKNNSDRLIRMVNTMLDIEKIELGAPEMNFIGTDLTYLIRETLTGMQADAAGKGITFSADVPGSLQVYADEDRIRRVLLNLVSNALKFSPEKSVITVRAFREDGYAVTEIGDEGPGVPQAEHEKIFGKFYSKGAEGGSGLGLAICRSIIEAHNGIIGVESSGEKGSRFYFKLPVSAGKTA